MGENISGLNKKISLNAHLNAFELSSDFLNDNDCISLALSNKIIKSIKETSSTRYRWAIIHFC